MSKNNFHPIKINPSTFNAASFQKRFEGAHQDGALIKGISTDKTYKADETSAVMCLHIEGKLNERQQKILQAYKPS